MKLGRKSVKTATPVASNGKVDFKDLVQLVVLLVPVLKLGSKILKDRKRY